MSLHDKLVAAGAECVHPKYIATIDGARVFVATCADGEVYLTEEGRTLLADPKEPKKARASKVAPKQVESANELVDDLDLGD